MKKQFKIILLLLCCVVLLTNITYAEEKYSTINDKENILSLEQKKEIEKDIAGIKKYNKEMDINTYFFVLNTSSFQEDTNSILNNYERDPSSFPIILFFNNKDSNYKIVMDERLKSKISKPFLIYLMENSFIKEKNSNFFSATKNLLIRLNTIVNVIVKTENLNNQENIGIEEINKENLNKIEEKNLSNVLNNKKEIPTKEIKPENKETKEETSIMTVLVLLIITASILGLIFNHKKLSMLITRIKKGK